MHVVKITTCIPKALFMNKIDGFQTIKNVKYFGQFYRLGLQIISRKFPVFSVENPGTSYSFHSSGFNLRTPEDKDDVLLQAVKQTLLKN